jgi:WD40 repeat protein
MIEDAHVDEISMLTVSANGKKIATASVDRKLHIWSFDEEAKRVKRDIDLETESYLDRGRFSPNGDWLITRQFGRPNLLLWNLRIARPVPIPIDIIPSGWFLLEPTTESQLENCSYSPDSNWLIQWNTGAIRLYNLAGGEPLSQYVVLRRQPNLAQLAPENIASGPCRAGCPVPNSGEVQINEGGWPSYGFVSYDNRWIVAIEPDYAWWKRGEPPLRISISPLQLTDLIERAETIAGRPLAT